MRRAIIAALCLVASPALAGGLSPGNLTYDVSSVFAGGTVPNLITATSGITLPTTQRLTFGSNGFVNDDGGGGNIQFRNAGNTDQAAVMLGYTQFATGSSAKVLVYPAEATLNLSSDLELRFSSTTVQGGSKDSGVKRCAAGRTGATDGAGNCTGQFTAAIHSTPATTLSPAAAATALAITRDIHTVDCDAGGNTIATITGGVSSQRLTLIFVDTSCTITDDATGNANTVNLTGAFTSTANDVVNLVFDGTSWRESGARAVN